MERIDRIGPRSPQWLHPAIDPNPEDIAERRRREDERRRRRLPKTGEGPGPSPEVGMPAVDDDPPHHIDVRA